MAGKALYDVFVSFSGAYRLNIVDVLCKEIEKLSINVFIDRAGIKEGDSISEKLLTVIPATDIYIPVFTNDYASKTWCLRELACMVKERQSNREKTILPIFLGVVPDDVQLKTPVYEPHLKEKEKTHGPEKVNQWRDALREAAQIKGFVPDMTKDRLTKFTEGVAGRVLSLLKQKVSQVLIGIDDRIDEVNRLLDTVSADVRYLVIRGVPGVGKTTLAKAVFNELSPQFEGASFLLDIRESPVLIDIPGDVTVRSVRERYRNKKVLLVFDDVQEWKQIEKLVGSSTWFGSGSLVIITTEDDDIEYMLKTGRKSYASFTASHLGVDEAVELFSWHAFLRKEPPEGYFSVLSRKAVRVVGSLPLGIKLLGSFLRRKDGREWEQTLEDITKWGGDKIKFIVEMSFNKLEKDEEEIFLDTACFFVGYSSTNPSYMWEASPLTGLNVLRARSLITLVDDGRKLWMHRLLKEFGRKKVEVEYDPLLRSRLWSHEEASQVLKTKDTDKNAKAICLTKDKHSRACAYTLSRRELSGLKKLRFLKVHCLKFDGELEKCLQDLRWLSWHHCPDDLSPIDLQLWDLAILDLSRSSRIKNTWAGWENMKELGVLKVLDLTGCKSLWKTPCFSGYKFMERLILEDCKKLKEIDCTIGGLSYLKYLNVRGCDELAKLPDELCSALALREIMISKKNRGPLEIPEEIGSLESLEILEIVNVKLRKLPGTISRLKKLERLSLSSCSGVQYLSNSIGKLSSLTELDISSSKLLKLPVTIGNATELRVMKMGSSLIRTLPPGIRSLRKLEEIHAKGSKLEEIPEEIQYLTSLKILDFSNTQISQIPSEIRQLSRLKKLDLESCDQISHLPSLPTSLITLRVAHTAHRTVGDLSNSSQSDNGSWIENLTKLEELKLCLPSAMALPSSISQFHQLETLDLCCQNIDSISQLPSSLSVLSLGHCKVTRRTISDLNNLSILRLYNCQVDELGIEGLEKLAEFFAVKCTFTNNIGLSLQTSLRKLYISGGSFPEGLLELSRLENLKLLEVWDFNGQLDIQGLGKLKHVEEFILFRCNSISQLKGLSAWKRLQVLEVWNCENLEHIDGQKHLERLCKRLRIVSCKIRDVDAQDDHPVPQRHN